MTTKYTYALQFPVTSDNSVGAVTAEEFWTALRIYLHSIPKEEIDQATTLLQTQELPDGTPTPIEFATVDYVDAQNAAQNAVQGGPFLPLSGGTVGPLIRTNISYDIMASGATGNGATDDTTAIQTWLNGLPHGVEVVLPATKQFLIDSADLTIPPGITVRGQGGMDTLELLLGPAFVLNPDHSIVVQSGVRLSNLKVLRKGLLSAPTTAQANTAVAAWIAEAPLRKTSASTASGNTLPFTNTTGISAGMKAYGEALPFGGTTVSSVVANTSVTFASVVNFPVPLGSYVHFGNSIGVRLAANHGGANFDRLFIMGFNTGILTEAGELFVDTIEADCITAFHVMHGGDAAYLSKVHCIPFYGGDWNRRTGPCFLLARADGWSLNNCSSVGWANGFILSAVGGVTLHRCWHETAFDGTTITTSFRSEGYIVNECMLDQCLASADCGFDMQHGSGAISLSSCMSAAGAGDVNNIAHFRLGPASYGIITSPIVIAGSITPFVVQSGVGQWHLTTPMVFTSTPNSWMTGAGGDIANVSIIGGPLNGPMQLSAFSGQPIDIVSPSTHTALSTFSSGAFFGASTGASAIDCTKHINLYGNTTTALYGFNVTPNSLNYLISGVGNHTFITGNSNANQFSVGEGVVNFLNSTSNLINMGTAGIGAPTFTTRSVGAKIMLYPGIGAASADVAIGLDANVMWFGGRTTADYFRWYGGTTLAAQLSGAGALSLTSGLGTFGTAAITVKPTVTGSKAGNAALASLITALASYGLVTDSTT